MDGRRQDRLGRPRHPHDVAVVWPGAPGTPDGTPVVLAICTDRPDPDADTDDVPLAEAAGIVLDALVGARVS